MSTTTPSPKTFIKFVDNTPKSFSNSNLHRAEITFNYKTVKTNNITSNNISDIKLKNIPTDITNVSIVYGVNSTVSKTPDTDEKNKIFYPVLTSAIINYGDKLNFFSNFSSNGFALNFTNNNISVTIPSAGNFFTPPIPDNFTVGIKIVILYSIDYKYYDTSSTYEYYQNQNISKYIGIF